MSMNIEIIKAFVNYLIENNINYPIALVGSAVNKLKYNDLDYLMVVDNIELVKNNICKLFNKYDVSICDDAIKIDNYLDIKISIALYEKEKVNQIFDDYITGKPSVLTHRAWCLGYWLPESFIINIQNMIILNDQEQYLDKIKIRSKKDSIYARHTIVRECLNEITLKYELLKKTSIASLEHNFYKNDIILAIIRGITTIKGNLLVSYKTIDKLIETLDYQELNEFIEMQSENAINSIIKSFDNYINWSNNIYLGTWQYSGDFKPLTEQEIIDLIKYAKEKGIHKFDTALVYGAGKVEKILGDSLDENDIILTKIPAKVKPNLNSIESLEHYYDYNYILDCIRKSCRNLKRNYVDICLLHNWVLNWNNNPQIIKYLEKLKESGYVKRIGISLPNSFENELSDEVLSVIDVIEAPLNSENKWILTSISKYKKYGIEIILRSLFLQGKEKNHSKYPNILTDAANLNTSLVVGMTTNKQIDENIEIIKGCKYE